MTLTLTLTLTIWTKNEEEEENWTISIVDQEAINLEQELGQYQWTPSNCTCKICTALNQINDKWDNWNPINHMRYFY